MQPGSTLTPNDYSFRVKDAIFGVQMLFIAIGATVMVPLLTGMSPSIALLTAGIGTLLFQILTKGQIPAFLGSSFAFVPATIYSMHTWGLSSTLFGLASCSIVYFLVAGLIYWQGTGFVRRIFPPIVTGPIIMAIGLILAPVAANMAMGKSSNGQLTVIDNQTALIIASISLATTLIIRLFGKGRIRLLPILGGIFGGYMASLYFGVVDFSLIQQTPWLVLPTFTLPSVNWHALILMAPLAAVTAIEHIGDIAAIGSITGRNYIQSPGLHRSLMGDGFATVAAGLLGGPPSITYAEITAAVAITKTYNPGVMTWASIAAICLAFVGKLGAFLLSIPIPVMGGILILLFGAISVTGLHLLMQSKENVMNARNMTIVGIVLVLPLGGMTIGSGHYTLSGIGLGGIMGIILNIILPHLPPEDEVITH